MPFLEDSVLNYRLLIILVPFLFSCSKKDAADSASLSANANGGPDGTIPQSGQEYGGGERIVLTPYGMSFLIPADWKGEVGEREFVLGHEETSAVALVTAARIAEADVRQAFTERIEIFEGIYMVPEGSPSESGNVTSSAYDITGEQDGSSWKGYIAATVGGFEWTSFTIGLAPSSHQDFLSSAVNDINSSIVL